MQTVGYTRDVAAHVEHRIRSLDLCALGSALCAPGTLRPSTHFGCGVVVLAGARASSTRPFVVVPLELAG
jgi:hypothetical protein